MNVEERIQTVLKFLNIEAEVITKPFKYHKDIHKVLKGIYILMQGDSVIYVGKGNIADRQRKHWKKANGDLKIKDPEGWHWLRKNIPITPSDWTIKYLILHKQTELSAVEGCLIHFFQPLANNETFIDEERSL
jgi:hypothetical protein